MRRNKRRRQALSCVDDIGNVGGSVGYHGWFAASVSSWHLAELKDEIEMEQGQ
jgi:hypothetical protein